jgi:type I restriction enzyme S subunit
MSKQSFIQLKELIGHLPKSKILAGASSRDGKYKFYLSGKKEGRIDQAISNKDAVIMGDGGVARIQFAKGNYSYSSHNFGFFSKNKNVETRYLYRALENFLPVINYQGFVGSGIKNIDKNFLFDLFIQIPSFSEQKKIASILTSVDEMIEITQRQIDKLQYLKKATMNELLTKGIGHTEFKDSELGRIPKSWKVLKISDLKLEIKNSIKIGPFGSSLSKKEMVTKGIKVYGQENIYENNFKLGKYFITKNKYEKLKTCTLKSNDVIISMMGTIGASTVFPADAEIGIMDSHLLRIQVKENLISPNFLSNQISNYEKISIQIRKMSQGGIMEGLNSQIIHSLKIIIPTLDEQKKILEIIESIQLTTTKVQYKLKQHQFLKKSLMQDLLTGKVRVKVN